MILIDIQPLVKIFFSQNRMHPISLSSTIHPIQMKEQSEREPLRAASVAVVAAIIDR